MTVHFWFHRPEELTHFFVLMLIALDQLSFTFEAHKIIAAFLVLASCRIMMNTIARDPDIAIFVEMVATTQVLLCSLHSVVYGTYARYLNKMTCSTHCMIG